MNEAKEIVNKNQEAKFTRSNIPADIVSENDSVYVTTELDKTHILKVYKFKAYTLIDIRSHYSGGPTKKGISLQPEIFEKIIKWTTWKKALLDV